MSAAKKLLAALLCAALLPTGAGRGSAASGISSGRAASGAARMPAAAQKADAAPLQTGSGKTALLPSVFLAPGTAAQGKAPASREVTAPAGAKRQKPALTAAERDRAERVVMASCGEVGNSLMAMANAQVIFDRTASGRFGNDISAVLAAPGQFEQPWKGPVNAMVRQAVAAVFDGGRRVTAVPIYYYINPYLSSVDPSVWEKDKRYVRTIGTGHLIHQYWTDK